MSSYRYNISLRIWHPTADPARFTAALGLEPKFVDVAGKPRVRKGKPLEFVPKESYWMHEFDASGGDMDVEEFLLRAATGLRVHSDFFSHVCAEGGKVEFFVGFFPEDFNCGFELSPQLQRLCVDLSLCLSFDIYGFHSGPANEA